MNNLLRIIAFVGLGLVLLAAVMMATGTITPSLMKWGLFTGTVLWLGAMSWRMVQQGRS